MKTKRYGIRYYIAALLLVLSIAAAAFALQAYFNEASVSLPQPKAVGNGESQTALRELSSMLNRSQAVDTRYNIIEDKNLFVPGRKAWKAPEQPKPAEVKKVVTVPAASRKGEVVLYGTFITPRKKYALVNFPKLPAKDATEKQKRNVVALGETVKTEASVLNYTIIDIQEDRITVQDQAGQRFSVELKDENKKSPTKTENKSAISVKTDTAKSQSVSVKSSEQEKKAPSRNVSGMSPGQINALPPHEKERLVKEGVLKKQLTPMGPMYRLAK